MLNTFYSSSRHTNGSDGVAILHKVQLYCTDTIITEARVKLRYTYTLTKMHTILYPYKLG